MRRPKNTTKEGQHYFITPRLISVLRARKVWQCAACGQTISRGDYCYHVIDKGTGLNPRRYCMACGTRKDGER